MGLREVQFAYGPTKAELWALKEACRKFDLILRGQKFTVETDCKALCHGFENIRGDFHGYMQTWAIDLMSHYDFDITHVPGKTLILADAISRLRNRHGEAAAPSIVPKETKKVKFNLLDLKNIEEAQQEDLMIDAIQGKEQKDGLWTRKGKIVIPTKLQPLIIEEVHQQVGHPGQKETIRTIH